VSAQTKTISEVVKEFEQSLQNLRPSTRRVYLAGARAAIRAARLELWQCPSATELLVARKIPHQKESTNLAFFGFSSRSPYELNCPRISSEVKFSIAFRT
jgi:hypothetical protein